MFNRPNLPKVGDEITLEGIKKTVTAIGKNSINDPVVCWTSKHEEGSCMVAIWNEWAHYAKLGKPLPRTRRSDMYD
jgi:hypothetical protein